VRVPGEIFVSFSVRGDPPAGAFVRLLLARLRDLRGLSPWIYESPGGRVEVGASIDDACRQRIEAADLFVLILNNQALQSDYVAMEVSHALWVRQQRRLKIMPVLATGVAKGDWPPHIREAAGISGVKSALQPEDAEVLLEHICRVMETLYEPPPPVSLRMPLRNRLYEAIAGTDAESPNATADVARLFKLCDKALQALAERDLTRALRLAGALTTELEDEVGGTAPYYLRVFEASIVLEQASAGQCGFDKARASFEAILADSGNRVDANAHAGLGHALLGQGCFAEALEAYARAARFLSKADPALVYGQIRASILARRTVPRAWTLELEQRLDAGMVVQEMGESSRVAATLCLAHAHAGDVDAAQRCWRFVSDPGCVFPELACDIAHWLEQCASYQGPRALRFARDVLQTRHEHPTVLANHGRLQLARKLCHVEFGLGLDAAAKARLGVLLVEFPNHILLRLDAAMFALQLGDRHTARTHCHAAIGLVDHQANTPPLDTSAFEHAKGLAHWLLGRDAESRDCHRRSTLPPETWYGTTIPRHHAAAR
jgi:tetratricopeptide (TPR) repeat protein